MARYTQQDQYTVGGLNSENESIEQAIADTLSRKGGAPNAMETTLDMNSNRIINLPEPVHPSEPLTLQAGAGVVEAAEEAEKQADRAERHADASAVSRQESYQFSQSARDSAFSLKEILDTGSVVLDFPLDLGFITDTPAINSYDLGGL